MKKTYFEKRLKRARQKLESLLSRADFQSETNILRTKWNIPSNGIKTEEKNRKWRSWLDQETERYVEENRPNWTTQMQKLLEQGKFHERDELNTQFNANIPLNAFHNEIWRLVHKYKVPAHWYDTVKRYLLFNDPNNAGFPIGNVTMHISWDLKTNHKQLSLIIYADTILEDIKSFWPEVMWEQNHLHDKTVDKFQPRPNMNLDKRVRELWSQKKTGVEIANTIQKEFEKPEFIYTDVSNSLKRYKKRFG